MLAAQGGDILLCHDGGGDRSETIKALRAVIPALKSRGLAFVML
jgi:peptidoglycan/xylan/chitin deacetylase (PgdA/CDA1 family)